MTASFPASHETCTRNDAHALCESVWLLWRHTLQSKSCYRQTVRCQSSESREDAGSAKDVHQVYYILTTYQKSPKLDYTVISRAFYVRNAKKIKWIKNRTLLFRFARRDSLLSSGRPNAQRRGLLSLLPANHTPKIALSYYCTLYAFFGNVESTSHSLVWCRSRLPGIVTLMRRAQKYSKHG
jgi:hypothetical protein